MTVEIKVRDKGPLKITGDVRLLDADGNEIDTGERSKNGTIVLCRCGESNDKPFCDKSHRDAACFRE